MNKLLTLKTELEARIVWLDRRIPQDGWSTPMITYFLTRKRTLEQIIKRIDELEEM